MLQSITINTSVVHKFFFLIIDARETRKKAASMRVTLSCTVNYMGYVHVYGIHVWQGLPNGQKKILRIQIVCSQNSQYMYFDSSQNHNMRH